MLNDIAAIATIVSAVVVLAAFAAALFATKFAWDSVVVGRDAAKRLKEAAELLGQNLDLQRQNLATAERIAKAGQDTVNAMMRLQIYQQRVLELSRYEYLLDCVTRIEATVRHQNSAVYGDVRNQMSDALDLFPTSELTRCRELTAAHIEGAGSFTLNAKNELRGIVSKQRDRLWRERMTMESDLGIPHG